MRPQMVMFFVAILIVGNILCLIADGDWFGAVDQDQMNSLIGHKVKETDGIPILTPVANFFSQFWKAVSWDFSFFDGGLQIIRWCLFALSAGAVYAIGQEFRSTITSIFGRR